MSKINMKQYIDQYSDVLEDTRDVISLRASNSGLDNTDQLIEAMKLMHLITWHLTNTNNYMPFEALVTAIEVEFSFIVSHAVAGKNKSSIDQLDAFIDTLTARLKDVVTSFAKTKADIKKGTIH